MIEKVNPKHPDKVADRIAGAIVDLGYRLQENPKIAVEVLIGHNNCKIIIESSVVFDEKDIFNIVYRVTEISDIRVEVILAKQDIEQAKKLVENAGNIPSYITVEHLKIPNENIKVKQLFMKEYSKNKFYKSPMNMRNIELSPDVKEKNIKIIKQIANENGVKVGVGDNDLHHLSQSRCCCGIDTIDGGAFDKWLKYNLTYFVTGDCDNPKELWTPCGNCNQCVYS